MVLNTVIAVGSVFVLMFFVASMTRAIGGQGLATFIGQLLTVGLLAAGLQFVGFVSMFVAIGLVSIVGTVRVFTYLWFWRLGRKILNGAYGEESMWAAEIAQDDDEFVEATAMLTEKQLTEIGIIAESKEELREKTIERAEKLSDAE